MSLLRRILFVRPNFGDFRSKDAMTPLVAALLKGLTPPDIEFRLADERVEPVPLDADVDLVAMSVETFTARRAYELADAFRARGLPVVMGGHHPTLCPDEAARHADAVVTGDAEGSWPQVLADAAAGQLRRFYQGGPAAAPGCLDMSVFAGRRYAPLSLIQHGRGCRFACDFCSVRAFYGASRPAHPVAATLDAFARASERRVFFVDDNLFADRQAFAELVDGITAINRARRPWRRVQWCCQASIDVTRDDDLLDRMAESGCFLVLIGFESLSATNLGEMAKGWNHGRSAYDHAVTRLHDRGIMIYGTFVFGYGADTPASFGEAVEFARSRRLCIANFNPLTPTPGTPLYDRLRSEGRLLYERWWLDPDYRYGKAVFRPERMTPEELERGCLEARMDFYRPRSIAARLWRRPAGVFFPRNLSIALIGNLVSRAEILAKQGRRLGEGACASL